MKKILPIIIIVILPIVTYSILELHFIMFGGYDYKVGKLSIDWLGIAYVVSATSISSILLIIIYKKIYNVVNVQFFIFCGLFTVFEFFCYTISQIGISNAIEYIVHRPLHVGLANMILFIWPVAVSLIFNYKANKAIKKDV